jgi:hypothetical protein
MRDFNGLVTELDSTCFPQVKYYHDNKDAQKMHYACELFNNGCLSLQEITKRLAKIVKETEEKIEQIILKYYSL